MFEAKELASPPEASLHLIEYQESPMSVAPLSELLNIFLGTKARSAALVSLQQYPCDVVRHHMELIQCFFKDCKANVLSPKAVRIRHLHQTGIVIDDPFLKSRNPTDHLGSKRTAVKGPIEGHDHRFFSTTLFDPVGASQFDGTLNGFRSRGQ